MISDFPATVTLPDRRQVAAARVVVDGGALWVFATVRRQPAVVFRSLLLAEYLPPVKPRPGSRRTAETAQGPVSWTVSGSCGCGNPLKSLRPQTLLDRFADTEVIG